MHSWLKSLARPRLWAWLTALLLMVTAGLYAQKRLGPTAEETSAAEFFGARLTHNDQEWLFSGKVNYRLGSGLRQLIQAGLPLYWAFSITRQTPWLQGLAQSTLEKRQYLYLIRYDAISQTYVIQNLTLNKRLEFKNLEEALNVMGYFDELEVAKRTYEPKEQQLHLSLAIQTHDWPLPLQVSAFLTPLYHFKIEPVTLNLPQAALKKPSEKAP
jgi:hypothetical protein